jgi:hypothetical protein
MTNRSWIRRHSVFLHVCAERDSGVRPLSARRCLICTVRGVYPFVNLVLQAALHLGCVWFWDEEEWNGTIPYLEPVRVFRLPKERNQLVPQKRIFRSDAERTGSTKSAGR